MAWYDPFPARRLGTSWGDGPARRATNARLFAGDYPAYVVPAGPCPHATLVIDCRYPSDFRPRYGRPDAHALIAAAGQSPSPASNS